jgi:hypothetical protein
MLNREEGVTKTKGRLVSVHSRETESKERAGE